MPSASVDIDINLPSQYDLGCTASICSRCKTLALVSCTIDQSGRHAVAVRMQPTQSDGNAQTEPTPSTSSTGMTSTSSSHPQQDSATQTSPQPTSAGQDDNEEGRRDPSPPPRRSTRARFALVPTDRATPVPPVRSSSSDDEAEDDPAPRSPYWNGARTMELWRRLDENRRSGTSLDAAIHSLQNEMYPLLPPSEYTIPSPELYQSLLSRLKRSYSARRAVRKKVVKRSEPRAKPVARTEPGWISVIWDSILSSPKKRKLVRGTEDEDDDMTLVAPSDSEGEDDFRGGKRRKIC